MRASLILDRLVKRVGAIFGPAPRNNRGVQWDEIDIFSPRMARRIVQSAWDWGGRTAETAFAFQERRRGTLTLIAPNAVELLTLRTLSLRRARVLVPRSWSHPKR